MNETLDVLVEAKKLLPAGSPIAEALGTRLVSVGRSKREAPGVDGNIFLPGDVGVGAFVRCTIRGYTDFDRYGTLAG